MLGQQNLDTAVKEIAGRGIAGAASVGARAFATAIEPRWKDAGIIEHDQIAGPQQFREVAKKPVGIAAAASLNVQHAGAVAGGKRFLGDESVGKVEVEVRHQHDVRL